MFLLSNRFSCSQADHSLFIQVTSNSIIYILVYVDDILITDNCPQAIQALLHALHQNFSIKNLGSLNYFLGIEVTTEDTTLHLSLDRYLKSILTKVNMAAAKLIHTHMVVGLQMSKFTRTKLSDPHLYRSIIGAL
jgi:Reverse transcriptase (RNA-dependent DNA polymerase)